MYQRTLEKLHQCHRLDHWMRPVWLLAKMMFWHWNNIISKARIVPKKWINCEIEEVFGCNVMCITLEYCPYFFSREINKLSLGLHLVAGVSKWRVTINSYHFKEKRNQTAFLCSHLISCINFFQEWWHLKCYLSKDYLNNYFELTPSHFQVKIWELYSSHFYEEGYKNLR